MWAAKRFYIGAGPRMFTLNISQSIGYPDIRSMAVNAGWNQQSALYVNITAPLVNSLFIRGGAFPEGLTIEISAATRVGGRRGGPDEYGIGGLFDPAPRHGGGTAIYTRIPFTLRLKGIVSGGGDQGVDGASNTEQGLGNITVTGPGGAGGSGQGFTSVNSLIVAAAELGWKGETVCNSSSLGTFCATGDDGSPGYGWGSGGRSIDGVGYITLVNEGGQLLGSTA